MAACARAASVSYLETRADDDDDNVDDEVILNDDRCSDNNRKLPAKHSTTKDLSPIHDDEDEYDKNSDAENNIMDDDDDKDEYIIHSDAELDDDDDTVDDAGDDTVGDTVDDAANIDPSLFIHPDDDVSSILRFFADDSNYENTEREPEVRVNNE